MEGIVMKRRRKRRGLRTLIILLLLCAVAGGGYYAWTKYMPGEAASGAPSISGLTQSLYTVNRMSFNVDISGNGSLKPQKTQVVKAPFSGEIEAVSAQNGDVVRAGDPVFRIREDGILDEIDRLAADVLAKDREIAASGSAATGGSILAPVAGVVKEIYAQVDDAVTNRMAQDGALCLLSTDGRMKVTFVPAEGERVTLRSELIAAMRIDGTTIEVECAVDSIDSNGVVTVTVEDDEYPSQQPVVIRNAGGELVGSGLLTPNKPVYVVGDTGTISSVRYKVGDSVSRRTTLFRLEGTILSEATNALIAEREALAKELESARARLDALTWIAPENGVIVNLSLQPGDAVSEKEALYTLQSDDAFLIVIAVDELDITSVEVGQSALVTVPALHDAAFSAEVTHISSSGYTESSVTTYDVTLALQTVEGIRSGMNAEANVTTVSRQDVLVVPASAVQSMGGRKVVQVQNGDGGNEPVDVEVGASNGFFIEILSGLGEGDRVVVNSSGGSGSGGNMNFMMMGGMPQGGGNWSGGGGNRQNRPGN